LFKSIKNLSLRVVGELVERMAVAAVANKVAGKPVLVARFVLCGPVAVHSHQLLLVRHNFLEKL